MDGRTRVAVQLGGRQRVQALAFEGRRVVARVGHRADGVEGVPERQALPGLHDEVGQEGGACLDQAYPAAGKLQHTVPDEPSQARVVLT